MGADGEGEQRGGGAIGTGATRLVRCGEGTMVRRRWR